ncbi:hypothetical protein ROLI_033560 [Roseobacter fucihabitans]|uniref:Uncharacterized protein n=1 Tax=Roseobacter fucihabitans TaxID=1537242 RepID=A0ABZ2C043_9RHOB|nr:hypothetical protein [Roseobacter litoralis]MBC6966774.1 hypothetical protein [Roseobacter litoralis]
MEDPTNACFRFFGVDFLPCDHFQWALTSFLSVALVGAVVALIAFLSIISTAYQRREIVSVLGALFVMALFGGLVGFHGGNSRVGVVGDVIPAVVTLVAGVAAYLFGVSERKPGPLMFPLLGAFVATLFMGYSMGSANRNGEQRAALADEQCFKALTNVDILKSEAAFARAQQIFGTTCEVWWELDGDPDT